MKLCSLASGSRGNALAVWSDQGGLLIDCGLSCRELRRRMAERSIEPAWFGSVLLTHYHGDHVRGLKRWVEQYPEVSVFGSEPTLAKLQMNGPAILDRQGLTVLVGPGGYDELEVAGFHIRVLSVVHNADGAVTYVIREQATGAQVALLYETGRLTPALAEAAAGCQALYLESNYDADMLEANPKLPVEIKERIAATHLSNVAAARYLATLDGAARLVLLVHLSQDNNTPELARNTAQAALDTAGCQARLAVAGQGESTEVFTI